MTSKPLSKLARDFAAEINFHDWSDAPFRADRAGHQRGTDGAKRSDKVLTDAQTDILRMNAMWIAAQVLRHYEPDLDVYRFAEACGVDTRTPSGRPRDGGITAGLRTDELGRAAGPVLQLFCHVCDRAIGGRHRGRFETPTRVRREGIVAAGGQAWVWGPVPVHEQCRTELVTPYDLSIGRLHEARFEHVDFPTAAREQRLGELHPHLR